MSDPAAALEAAIADDPDDAAAYLVYGDYLQRRGDPRGELIALAAAAEAAAKPGAKRKSAAETRYGAHFAKHAKVLLGALAPLAGALTWRHGFIARAELAPAPGRDVAASVAQLLAHPSGRLLRELVVAGTPGRPGEGPAVLDAVIDAAPPALRELDLRSDGALGDLAPVWRAVPRLARLALVAEQLELGALALPGLRRLRLVADELSGTVVRSLAAAPLPVLERLELRFGSAGAWLADFDDVVPLLRRRDLPALTHLRLRRATFAGAILRELLAAPLLPQLSVLDLSGGSFNPSDIDALVGAADRLAHLRELWLPLTRLRADDRRRAEGLGKHVISDARAPQDFGFGR